jgi:starch-binding outer membrane protein, SusD/RagB family
MSFYKRTAFENRVFQKKHYLWPIPQRELDVDKNLVQNTGW